MSKLIIFVCTGNTCRSPMAEYYFNYKVDGHKVSADFTATSCGLRAEIGGSMAQNSRQVLLDNNIISDDYISHKPTQVSKQIMRQAFLIYGITVNHAAILRDEYPEYADKIREMPENIGDPYGSILEVYAACFKRIKSAIDIIIEELRGDNL